MGRSKTSKGRLVNGILLFDKPAGMTSNQALQKVKTLFFARKAGHTGSLDPLATGVLPICFGEATKVSPFLLDADKRYRVTGKLGITTNTGDSEGEIVEQREIGKITEKQLEKVLKRYTGEIDQLPPMFSALKKDGKRLYELARQGIEVERETRRITIYALELIKLGEQTIELDVSCSKGTYVRTLVEDIGRELGCGAHVIELRRTRAGSFGGDNLATLEQLTEMREQRISLDGLLLPPDSALEYLPAVNLDENLAFYLLRGQPIQVPEAPDNGLFRIYHGETGEFLGIGEISPDGMVAPKRLFSKKD